MIPSILGTGLEHQTAGIKSLRGDVAQRNISGDYAAQRGEAIMVPELFIRS